MVLLKLRLRQTWSKFMALGQKEEESEKLSKLPIKLQGMARKQCEKWQCGYGSNKSRKTKNGYNVGPVKIAFSRAVEWGGVVWWQQLSCCESRKQNRGKGKSAFQDAEQGKNGWKMGEITWVGWKRKSSRRGAGTWRRISSMMTHTNTKKKRTKESTRKLVKTFFSVCFPTFGRFCAARPHKTCHSWPQIQLTFICENIAAVLGVLAHPTPLSHSTDPILLWSSFSRSVFYFATHSYTHACTDGIFNFHCRSKLLLKWHFKNLIASSAPPTTQGWKMPSSSVWESCPLEQLLRQIASHRLHKEKNFQ